MNTLISIRKLRLRDAKLTKVPQLVNGLWQHPMQVHLSPKPLLSTTFLCLLRISLLRPHPKPIGPEHLGTGP